MRLAWGAKVSPLFRERLLAMCVRLGINDPNDMMGCIAFETGHTFSSRVVNAQSGATGLIQFMPSTARGMGTTVEALKELSPEDQLAWVEKYFQPYAGRLHSLDDVYMAILWPRAVGKLLSYPLFSKDDADSRAYFGNKGLDVNADGVVTKGEATAYVQKALNVGLQTGNWIDLDTVISPDSQDSSDPIPTLTEVVDSPQPQPEKPMGPLLFLPAILQMIPQLLKVPGLANAANASSTTGASSGIQKVADFLPLIQVVVDTFTKAVPGAINEQQAVQMAQADAKIAAKASQAVLAAPDVVDELNKLAPVLDRLHKYEQDAWVAEDKSRDDAANRAIAQQREGPLYNNPTFLLAILIMMLVCTVVIAVLFKGGFSTDMQAFVIGAVVGAALQAVQQFYFGSSRSSAAKDATISRLTK